MRKLKTTELDRITIEAFKTCPKTPLVIVLDNIRSLNNIGSVFRTSDAFLIEAIYLCGITACPPHRDIHKTALGATESVQWKYFKNTCDAIQELKENGFQVLAVEQAEGSIPLEKAQPDFSQGVAIVMGNEVKGVDSKVMEMVDQSLEITQYGTKHSLNVSVTTGIVIWELFKKYTLFKSQQSV